MNTCNSSVCIITNIAQKLAVGVLRALILWPARIAAYFQWAAPLLARVVVGYVFMLTGWGKLNNLPQMIDNFRDWGIPYPEIMTPIASGIECFGGALLILGLFTRVAGGALAVVMVVAVISAKWADIDSAETLLGFEEAAYFVIFTWLAIAGAGKVALDSLIERKPVEKAI
ncbi:MAG: DoxX family protein [Rickettsiales bacterium]